MSIYANKAREGSSYLAHVLAVWLSMSKRYYCRKNRFTLPEHKNCLTHFFSALNVVRLELPFQLITRALQSFLCSLTIVSEISLSIKLDDLLFLDDDDKSKALFYAFTQKLTVLFMKVFFINNFHWEF
jgi:hypothetical protein